MREHPAHRIDAGRSRRASWRTVALTVARALALAAAVPTWVQAEARKAETPDAVYEREAGCAAIAAAAIVREGRRPSVTEKERADARTVVAETETRAKASGRKLGLPPARVADDIRKGRDGILSKIAALGGDRAAVQREDADLGRILIACAMVAKLKP